MATVFGKQTPKTINFKGCNYREHGQVKHYRTPVWLISLNVVGQSINQSYVLKGNVRPFYVNQRMSLVNIHQGRGKNFSEVRNNPQGTPKFILFDYSYQRVNRVPLGICPSVPPAVRLAETFLTQAASLVTMVMTVKTLLHRSLPNY